MMKHSLLALAALGASAQVAFGQSAVPPRPAPVAPGAFTFPHVNSYALPNGLRVLIVEDHSIPVVTARAVLGVDETADPVGKEGLYQVMLGALREGTTTRTPEQIAEASAKAGTPLSPTQFTTSPAEFNASLALMGDMLMHPGFPQAGFDRRKATQAAVFRNFALRPAWVPRNLFYSLLDGRDDPVTRNYYASESSVSGITRDDVVHFYDEHVGPKGTTIVIVGDVTDGAALAAARRVFGSWKRTTIATSVAPVAEPSKNPTTIYLMDVPGTASYIYMGNAGPARTASDAFAAEMAGTIAANRFVSALREKRALMYSGGLGIVWHPAPRASEFFGSTNVAAPKADSALVEWLAVLRGLRGDNPPTARELENAKRARVGPLWTKTDGPDSTATRIVEAVRDHLQPNFLQTYAAGMNAVTLADVSAAAAKYIDVDHLVIVVSGDRKVLEPALRAANIAPIVIVDANGKPLP